MLVKLLILLYMRMYLIIAVSLIMCSLISVIIPVWRQGLKLVAILTKNMRASRNAGTPARLDDNAEESTPTEQEPPSATGTSRSIRKFYACMHPFYIAVVCIRYIALCFIYVCAILFVYSCYCTIRTYSIFGH